MEKINKWERLKVELMKWRINFQGISNLTAEQCGALSAYTTVFRLMTELEILEKKLDKA